MFCCYYVISGDPAEAAVKAGFGKEDAVSTAASLLKDQQCLTLISELKSIFSENCPVKTGLKRLAFGSSNDAVSLAFAEEFPAPEAFASLDLFNVSEIKRDRNGGVEIRFFDRIKALEKLYEIENDFDNKDTAAGLMSALTASAGEVTDDDN